MKGTSIFFLLLCFLPSCRQKASNEVIVDNKYRAVGNISNDTTYDGNIEFYDINTGNLAFSVTYKDGMLNGEKRDYYSNGKVYSISNYTNGLLNGVTNFFDSTGLRTYTQENYYGLNFGRKITYNKEGVKKFDFYSFDNELLFSIDYDSLKKNKITSIQNDFFFYNEEWFKYLSDSDNKSRKEYFIYLPNPPKFRFEYSVVEIDNHFNVLSEPIFINKPNGWTTFSISKYESQKFAIRLVVNDSVNNDVFTMFKKL